MGLVRLRLGLEELGLGFGFGFLFGFAGFLGLGFGLGSELARCETWREGAAGRRGMLGVSRGVITGHRGRGGVGGGGVVCRVGGAVGGGVSGCF